MKKRVTAYLTTILIFLMLPTITAQTPNIFRGLDLGYGAQQIIDQVISFLTPFFQVVIGEYSTSEFFFHKILLLILLIVIVKAILEKTPIAENNKQAGIIIALIISVLAIRFINENQFFEAIFIQYGVLGIAITTILPMVIFFYFVHNTKVGSYGRKVFWAIYIIILIGIWIVKSAELPEAANWIYGLTILSAGVFLIFDKSIHAYFGIKNFKNFDRAQKKESIKHLRRRIVELEKDHRDGVVTDPEYESERKRIQKQIRQLSKE
jgi:hypothetical protein